MTQTQQQDQQTIVLEEPRNDQWYTMQNMLMSHLNKQQLLNYAEAFIPWLGKYSKVQRVNSEGKLSEAVEIALMMKPASSKDNIARGLALILGSNHNLQLYLQSMSAGLHKLWQQVMINFYVSHPDAIKIVGRNENLFSEQKRYYYSESYYTWNRREYQLFATSYLRSDKRDKFGYREYERFICLDPTIREIFAPLFLPQQQATELSLTQLPEGNWQTFNFEAESLLHYNLFLSLMQQGELPLRAKGLGLNEIRRAAKKLNFDEFFPDDACEYRKGLHVKTYLTLLGIFLNLGQKKKKDTAYEDTLRSLVSNISWLNNYLSPLIFPHIKGLRRSLIECGRDLILVRRIFDLLTEESENWLSVQHIYQLITALEISGSSFQQSLLVYHPSLEQEHTLLVNEYTGRIITPNRYTQEFGMTAIRMCAFWLASLGMAEVALCEKPNIEVSPFDRLAYLRLTPLGRYAFGVADSYEAPAQEHVAYFELDPDRLIIRSLVDPNPYAKLLTDTSVAISKNRYETSALSFLASCHTKADVESKMTIFRQFIASELPPLWEQFFKTLLQHCHPLKEDKTGYKRYSLDPENRDLIQLVTTDPVLRQIVIRAEGFRILVKNDDLTKFETQLKKHGYLL